MRRPGPDLDLSPPVRLDLWVILLSTGLVVGTVAPPLAPVLLVAGTIVAMGALLWRDLVPIEWRLMAVLAPFFAAGGVAIAVLHAATPDPLAELAAMEPGEVVLVGRIASPPEKSGFGYMADVRVERLWYEGREVLHGGGVEFFAGDLSIGVGDRVRVDGEISRPQIGEDGFVYGRYLAKKSLAAFNARLHEETDLDALSEGLVGVAGIMQCKHISLYLRPETSSKEARTEQRPLIHPSA